MKKVLFVCTGNTCRSPMAMFLFEKRVKSLKKNIQVDSAGLDVKKGDCIAKNAVFALERFDIKKPQYFSKQLNKQLFMDADLVVTMTQRQKRFLPQSKKVVSFFDLTGADVIDPFGQDEQTYFNCATQMIGGFDKILEKLD